MENQQKPEIATRVSALCSYGLRRLDDFDKYSALSMADSLAYEAKVIAHEKASFYAVAAQALRDRLEKPKAQFHSYFMALFSDRDFGKVLECISKVDKSFGNSPSSSYRQQNYQQRYLSRDSFRSTRRIVCYSCGTPGHLASRCFQKLNDRKPYSRPTQE